MFPFAPTTPGTAGIEIDPSEAHRRQQGGALLVDVREDAEWAGGHAAGAQHVPLGQLPARLTALPQDREVLFICASGGRSGAAAELLRARGRQDVFSVAGGTATWAGAGLPVER